MRILVTGSAGHLGEALCRSLQSSDHTVVSCDLHSSPYTTWVGDLSNSSFAAACAEGVDVILHTATLHKPHVATHTKQAFIDANVTATLNLLEAAAREQVSAFIFTSTTSTFGSAMAPEAGGPAVWVTEDLQPVTKNIYGMTKLAAEDLCWLFHQQHQLPCIILKTSRFFLEIDDDPLMRGVYTNDNIKANEFLFRRVDLHDVVDAHFLAMDRAADIGFRKYIITARTPFRPEHLATLHQDAAAVLKELYPAYSSIYKELDWKMFDQISRVYVSELAQRELGWEPRWDFEYILACLTAGEDYRSALSMQVGIKGHHNEKFIDGPYPV